MVPCNPSKGILFAILSLILGKANVLGFYFSRRKYSRVVMPFDIVFLVPGSRTELNMISHLRRIS